MIRFGLAALLFVSNEAHAFELTTTATGAEVRWDPPSLSYGAVFAEERFDAACRAAADTWVIGSKLGVAMAWEGAHAAIETGDGANTIAVVDDWDDAFGDVSRTVAHTELVYAVDTGLISEGDIFLNGATFTFDGEGAFDAQSVVLHEMGHLLGLAHSCGDPGRTYPSCFSVPEEVRSRVLDAVMAPTLAPGVERRTLGDDDLDALRVHYDGTADGAVPRPQSLSRVCPEGALVLTGIVPATVETSLRRADGSVGPLAPEWEGRADVIVRDPETGLFGALYAVESPAPCETEDPMDGGCSCRAHRQGDRNGFMLSLVIGVVMLAARRKTHLLVLVSALWAGDAFAYKCSRVGANVGPSLVWTTRTIPMYADEALFDIYGDRAKAEEDVRASLSAWTDVDCSDLTLPLAAIIPGLRAGYEDGGENKNVIVSETNWLYDRGALAITTSAYDTRTGVVVDADIEINDEFFDFARVGDTCSASDGTMDLRNTVTHEAGHVVGLDHPPDMPRYEDVTMYASAPACETKKRTLAQDDIDGICAIYPTGLPTEQCFPPDGPSFVQVDSDDGFGGCATAKGELGLWIGLCALALILSRRGPPSS